MNPLGGRFSGRGGGTCTILYKSHYYKYYYNNIRCNML